jgi:hypothetical protein
MQQFLAWVAWWSQQCHLLLRREMRATFLTQANSVILRGRGLCGVVKLMLLPSSTYDQYQHNEKLFVWKLHPFW